MSSSKALRTVRPPKPESNTPMVGRRGEVVRASPLFISSRVNVRPGLTVSLSLEIVGSAQHGPGGIGAPCGHVCGCPRNVQILSVASGERMCSNLQACCSISDSLSIARLSVKSRSASRCRRMMPPARSRPRAVSPQSACRRRAKPPPASAHRGRDSRTACDHAAPADAASRPPTPSQSSFQPPGSPGSAPCTSMRSTSAISPCSASTQSSSSTSSSCSSSASEKISCDAILP